LQQQKEVFHKHCNIRNLIFVAITPKDCHMIYEVLGDFAKTA
jgi:hypothetical protein